MLTLKKTAFLTAFLLAVSATPLLGVQARTPNDPLYAEQWYLSAIGAEAAWNRTIGSSNVVVAIIDTAIDIDHEDLKENIWQNADEVFGNAKDDDNNGFVDDVYGWNFVDNTWDVRPKPNEGDEIGYVHGTIVASLIGAKGDNGVGIAGVAWNVTLMPIVALDTQGNGSVSNVTQAIRYAVANGADIINVSLEGYSDMQPLEDALREAQQAGVLTVAAAGNAEDPEGIDLDTLPVFPACLSNKVEFGVFGAGSVDREKKKAPFANYGSCVLASAPGNDIFGARPVALRDGESQTDTPGYSGGFSGTSLATPLVTGAAALLKSLRPDWGWAELREWLMASAAPIDHLQDSEYRRRVGRGLIDIGAAVASVPNPEAIGPSAPVEDPRATNAADELQARERNTIRIQAGDGIVVAETAGGRAWGIQADGTTTLFRPYGNTYRAGLNAVAVPGGVAFAPRGGGGHLMVTDLIGRRMVSAFPFGKTARGRWSVSILPASQGNVDELAITGPLGTRALPLNRLGADEWRDITL